MPLFEPTDTRQNLIAYKHHLNSPLRTGTFLISKTESVERNKADKISQLNERLMDNCFIYYGDDDDIKYADPGVYILQYRCGYLWLRWVRNLSETDKMNGQFGPKDCSINETGELKGERYFQYREKTHLIFSITNGGRSRDESKYLEVAKCSQSRIQQLLQNSDGKDIVNKAISFSNATSALMSFQQTIDTVNEFSRKDPEFRNSINFPSSLILRLKLKKNDPSHSEYVDEFNRLLIQNISSIFIHFPLVSSQDAIVDEEIEKIQLMTKSDPSLHITVVGNGIFSWKD